MGEHEGKKDKKRTNYHAGELETLANALPMDLVGQVGETDVTHEFFSDDIGSECRGGTICETAGRQFAVADGRVGVCHLKKRKTKKGNIRMGWCSKDKMKGRRYFFKLAGTRRKSRNVVSCLFLVGFRTNFWIKIK